MILRTVSCGDSSLLSPRRLRKSNNAVSVSERSGPGFRATGVDDRVVPNEFPRQTERTGGDFFLPGVLRGESQQVRGGNARRKYLLPAAGKTFGWPPDWADSSRRQFAGNGNTHPCSVVPKNPREPALRVTEQRRCQEDRQSLPTAKDAPPRAEFAGGRWRQSPRFGWHSSFHTEIIGPQTVYVKFYCHKT